jgi:trigger factor
VIEFYANNPQAMAEIRVPLFEDKVIDFLGELMEVKDRKVSQEILFLDPDDALEKLKEAETAEEPAKPAKKAKAKDDAKPKAKAEDKEKKAKGEEKPKTRKKKE